jgi:DNA adenine methylase
MPKSLSPLRYPGGKSKIYKKVRNLIITNGYEGKTYVEPFAGGFGIGIGLLCEGIVKSAILNDFDSHIYHFWHSVLNNTDDLLRLISDTQITVDERERQKQNYWDTDVDPLHDGFATLFLNRVNFSGIIKGGSIGGLTQIGTYKIDCRFNKNDIINKIEAIAKLKEKIKLYNNDAGYLIKMNLIKMKTPIFLNIDPPYVIKGSRLYTNYFNEEDHIILERIISKYLMNTSWIVTYDDCELIREIYKGYNMVEYGILHNAGKSVAGKEIVITNLPAISFVW